MPIENGGGLCCESTNFRRTARRTNCCVKVEMVELSRGAELALVIVGTIVGVPLVVLLFGGLIALFAGIVNAIRWAYPPEPTGPSFYRPDMRKDRKNRKSTRRTRRTAEA
jgi:hypothetical protein